VYPCTGSRPLTGETSCRNRGDVEVLGPLTESGMLLFRRCRRTTVFFVVIVLLWALVPPITFSVTISTRPKSPLFLITGNGNSWRVMLSSTSTPSPRFQTPNPTAALPAIDTHSLMQALFQQDNAALNVADFAVIDRRPRELKAAESKRQAAHRAIQADLAAIAAASPARVLEWPRTPPYVPQRRLLVISIGGVGTTPLMLALLDALAVPHINMTINSPVDKDGLKHVWVSAQALPKLLAFQPAAVLYLLGDPLPAIYSHFTRAWAGVQMCKVAPNASVAVRANQNLMRLLRSYFFDSNDFVKYGGIVDEAGFDYFQTLEHAWSWVVGAPHLGVPVLFATLETVLTHQAALLAFLQQPNATLPLLRMPLFRNSSFVRNKPPVLPKVEKLYRSIYDELVRSLDGRCLGSSDRESWSGALCRATGFPAVDAATMAWDTRLHVKLPDAAPAISLEGNVTLDLLAQCERLGPPDRKKHMSPEDAKLRRTCALARSLQPACTVIRPQRPRRAPSSRSPSRSLSSTPFKSPSQTPTGSPVPMTPAAAPPSGTAPVEQQPS
jgi:hypothetical protein